MGGIELIIFWLIGLFILYYVIYLAVKNAINDSNIGSIPDAVQRCKVCGNLFQDKAENCPKCGNPF